VLPLKWTTLISAVQKCPLENFTEAIQLHWLQTSPYMKFWLKSNCSSPTTLVLLWMI